MVGNDEFLTLDLENFSIYRPNKIQYRTKEKIMETRPKSNELAQLHDLGAPGKNNLFFFDGIICYGDARRYVQKVPFEILSIGGYEDTTWHTVGSSIWIQSQLGNRHNIWYRLTKPAREYEKYHEPFRWIADLAKHVVDYVHCHKQVTLSHFEARFYQWLQDTHGLNEYFQDWLKQSKSNLDFRSAVAAQATFLYNQAQQLDPGYVSHPFWDEIHPSTLNAVPHQHLKKPAKLNKSDKSSVHFLGQKTVVTSYVFETFKHLPFASFCEVVRGPQQRTETKLNALEIAKDSHKSRVDNLSTARDLHSASVTRDPVCIGDVVAVGSDSKSKWKHNDSLWYGYVQGIKAVNRGQRLSILWLYRPSDTPCQNMRYPHSRELFLSDHCNCGDHPIYAHEVSHKPTVAFFKGPESSRVDFFVRQKYVGADSAWVTMRKSDFSCKCNVEPQPQEYHIGDTLLVAKIFSISEQVLEPVVVVEMAPDGFDNMLRVRRLLRRKRDYGQNDAEPNELVYTEEFQEVATADVFRRCHIRFYTCEDKANRRIPAPYSRQGTADCYYITDQDSGGPQKILRPMTRPWPPAFHQGWDPLVSSAFPKMKGLDIFCGGGNLGRGLEEGGAVDFRWAVDYFKEAIHTYKANLKHPLNTKLFYGSVNDYLRQAILQEGGELIAKAGEVCVISAGSPCQGYSALNQSRGSDQSLLNVSMVASVVSFIDFYRPKYALLENVLGMAKCGVKGKEENVFAQVICALVGMGYQVRPYTLDAWSFGSPQSRTRLFISIAAAGLTPLPDPAQSHSHPDGIPSRSLGTTANGLPLGSRYWDLTPFEYVTIGEATKDLPVNEYGKTSCIPFPDHRVTKNVSVLNQNRIACIPLYPRGMNFVKAAKAGLMPPPQFETLLNLRSQIRFGPSSRSWQRVNPDALIPTVTTNCQPEDGIAGSWVHWDRNRLITVMEVRRAQGFPDHEVIVGLPAMQWKIVGNSVARPVALALGMSLRTAWLENCSRVKNHSSDAIKSGTAHKGHSRPMAMTRPEVVVSIPDTLRDQTHDWIPNKTKIKAGLVRNSSSSIAYSSNKHSRSSPSPGTTLEAPRKKQKLNKPTPFRPSRMKSEIILISSESGSDSESPVNATYMSQPSTAESSLTVTREATVSEPNVIRNSQGKKTSLLDQRR